MSLKGAMQISRIASVRLDSFFVNSVIDYRFNLKAPPLPLARTPAFWTLLVSVAKLFSDCPIPSLCEATKLPSQHDWRTSGSVISHVPRLGGGEETFLEHKMTGDGGKGE